MADGGGRPNESVVVRAAIDTRMAADKLLNFGLAVRSWGVWALVLGVGFAGAALGLRFDNPGDMQAPEFISCLSFSSIVAITGGVIYVVELFTRRTVYGAVLTIEPDATVIAKSLQGGLLAPGPDGAAAVEATPPEPPAGQPP